MKLSSSNSNNWLCVRHPLQSTCREGYTKKKLNPRLLNTRDITEIFDIYSVRQKVTKFLYRTLRICCSRSNARII